MRKVVAASLLCLWSVLAIAVEATDDYSSAQIGAIEITADVIEMINPRRFHANGNVVISGRGEEIRAHKAIIIEERYMVTIEAEVFAVER